MPLILSQGVRITFQGIWTNGRPINTVWHARVAHITNRAVAVPNATLGVLEAWATHVVPLLPNNYSVQNAHFVDLHTVNGVTGTVSRATPATGGITAAAASPYTGLMVRKLYGSAFRGKRSGRVFLPGLNESQVDEDGIIFAATRDTAVNALVAFAQAANAVVAEDVQDVTLIVAHTPSERVTQTKTISRPLKDGTMSSDDITNFQADAFETGIRRRITGK